MSKAPDHARLGYIDGLRAISVLAVVVFHLGLTAMPQGFLGVDVFFVISGFVITRSLLSSEPGRLIPFLERFYRRRFWRLVPALAAMVGVTLVAVAFLVPPVWISRHIMYTGIGSLFGMSNLVLAGSSGAGYFDQEADFNPFLHTWSLGVEEQFYVLYPLILWVVLVLALRGRRWARWVIPALGLLSLGIAVWMSFAAPTLSFYLLPTRFWELAAGAMAFTAIAAVSRIVSSEKRMMLLAWVGLALVVGSFFLPKSWQSPFPAGLMPVAGAMLLLWFGAVGRSRRASVGTYLSLAPMTYIGRISYSLYLWHWPVIVIMRWTIGVSDWWTILLATVLSLLLAMASYHFIERPFQRLPLARIALPSPLAVATGAVIVASAVAVYVNASTTQFVNYLPSRSVTVKDPTFNPLYLPSHGWVSAEVEDEEAPELLFLGDSHASMYHGASLVVANELGYRYVNSSAGDCGFTLLRPIALDGACSVQLEALDELEEGDVVVFAALRIPRYVDQDGILREAPDPADPARIAEREAALEQFLPIVDDLRERGVGVVLASPTPLYEYIPLRCSDWFNSMNPVCDGRAEIPRAELLERAAPAQEGLDAVLATRPDVVSWDVFDVLCPDPVCSIFDRDGLLLFQDQDHVGGRGNEAVLPSLREAVASAVATASR